MGLGFLLLTCVWFRYDDDDFDDASKTTTSSIFSCKSEAFETRERRAYALAVLDRPEQLMMYANTSNDVRITTPAPHPLFFLASSLSSFFFYSIFSEIMTVILTYVWLQSLASQRLRFTAMMCGYEDEADWRNNAHFKTTLSVARERHVKTRKAVNNMDLEDD